MFSTSLSPQQIYVGKVLKSKQTLIGSFHRLSFRSEMNECWQGYFHDGTIFRAGALENGHGGGTLSGGESTKQELRACLMLASDSCTIDQASFVHKKKGNRQMVFNL